MATPQNNIENSRRKNPRSLWLAVLLTILAVLVIWLVWLRPASMRYAAEHSDQDFNGFAAQLRSSFSIFNSSAPADQSSGQELNDTQAEALRSQVFGDWTER